MDTETVTEWWGTFDLDAGRGGRWDIGPCTLWLYRTAQEWRVLYRSSPDHMASGSAVEVPLPEDEMTDVLAADDPAITIQRHSFKKTEAGLALHPALADRPVIVRPENPLYIPSQEEVTLYVSTPLWVQVEVRDGARQLGDLPTYRASDTWFGPSTREGELCYAARTSGRSRLENLPLRMHRAVTPLVVRNRASDALLLERVQIPTPYLPLYCSPDHYLWTPAVTLSRAEGGEGATVDIKEGAPQEIQDPRRVRDPRQELKTGLVVSTFKALGALFGH